ncbi:cytochrome P450 87A3-like [Hevea brasiliensis]|uniref:cytochrome P450 87A3-like n=1 Tax=Hevea brasiliensis TaxID=3981 RepID=UPI0025D3160A|nr:cytochrome P450 87A3-like [Hevea brasiliensis]
MWSYWVYAVALVVVGFTHWIYRWRNPKCNGKLPPGSMGFPLIGETIKFLKTSKTLDIPPFMKERLEKYGPLFKTSLAGRPVVVSSDPDFSYYLLLQEGKLVERWYLDSFAKLLRQDVTSICSVQYIHKYLRNLILSYFGPERLKGDLMPALENDIRRSLKDWSKLPSVEAKSVISTMIFDFTARRLYGYEAENSPVKNLAQSFTNFLEGLMKFPLNVPGTSFHKCKKNQKRIIKLIAGVLEERRRSPRKQKEDLLDQVVEDMKKETFLTDDFAIYMMFGLLLASFETISSTLALAIKFLTDNPSVVERLTEEHEAILKNRGNANSGLSWEEYKSMTYTHHVIKESLRLASVAPGILRRSLTDIQVDGYTIPKGWAILVVPAAVQLNPTTYEDPLAFNPSRWENMGELAMAKNFIAFGGGSRSCTGAEFSKVLMAVVLHVLVTKYRWTKVKGGEKIRRPVLAFKDGFHVQVTEKL